MPSWKYLLQALAYVAFIVVVGFLSVAPRYQHADPDKAVIKIAFSHAAERKEPCRQLTPEEIARLAPNMRRPTQCGRERLPVLVELEMDGEVIYRAEEIATGLWNDGPSTIYRKFTVAPGTYELVARLRDKRDTVGFDYEQQATVELTAGQNFVVGFRSETGGFRFQ